MPKTLSDHDRVVKAVIRKFKYFYEGFFAGEYPAAGIRLWQDFAARLDLSSTRKPEIWTGALLYLYDRLQVGWISQQEIAAYLKVSPTAIRKKYREMAETLGVVWGDPRYLAEGRRRNILRKMGAVPEDLSVLESLRDHRGSASEESLPYRLDRAMQEAVKGLEAYTNEEIEDAKRHFLAALRLDEHLTVAHNGLGRIALEENNLDESEAYLRKSIEITRESISSLSPAAFDVGDELQLSIYLEAVQGLGTIYMESGRFREAAAEFEEIHRFDPDENEGLTFLLGPIYHVLGDRDLAGHWYGEVDDYLEVGLVEPHVLLSFGQFEWESGRLERALEVWRLCFFGNIYLAPMLLGLPLPEGPLWLTHPFEGPDYAEDNVQLWGDLWRRNPSMAHLLRRLWFDTDIAADRERWLQLGQTLYADAEVMDRTGNVAGLKKWKRRYDAQQAIEMTPISTGTLKRVRLGEILKN
ncbi:MAG: tetratricopeptide repeat protein [Rhodothermales bacterium]|nr:tetratricopeptide repeat protein [Rhodothermales bacterium]